MTELERYIPREPQPRGELAEFVDNFRGVAEIAGQLARTRFVPQSLWVIRHRDGVETFDFEATATQVTAVILTGQELGLGPLASLRSVDIIENTPALRAVALRAVLLAHGHDIWVEAASNTAATVSGQRAGSSRIQTITWTMDDARARNLAGKRNWKTQPRNMLIARATGDVARLVAADAIAGIAYTSEELEDGAGISADAGGRAVTTPAEPVRRTRRPPRKPEPPGPPPADEPALDDEPAAAEPVDEPADEPALDEDDATPDPITDQQSKLLHVRLRQRFADDRDAWLTHISETVGRPVDSTAELTVAEASIAIDSLGVGPE